MTLDILAGTRNSYACSKVMDSRRQQHAEKDDVNEQLGQTMNQTFSLNSLSAKKIPSKNCVVLQV